MAKRRPLIMVSTAIMEDLRCREWYKEFDGILGQNLKPAINKTNEALCDSCRHRVGRFVGVSCDEFTYEKK